MNGKLTDDTVYTVSIPVKPSEAAQTEAKDQEQFLTFVTFDTGGREPVRTLINAKPIGEVSDLTEENYRPNGCTPLYDAMGESLARMEQKVADGDKVLVTVITDGYENASTRYSGADVKRMVERLREKGWTFVYIGANQDAVEVAKGLSISNALNFDEDDAGTREMWERHNRSSRAYYEKVRMAKMRGERYFEDEDFFLEKMDSFGITPERITSLNPGEIFVFGSNIAGQHNGGAAGYACRHFGAVYGQPTGPQGQCYAIVTVGCSLTDIEHQVRDFTDYAIAHPDLKFLVTAIGCGNGGWSPFEIAPLFADASHLPNVCLPAEFRSILARR